ncbi:MAG: hypothetical protein IPJ27_24445 [Candidatus Accumulibacter sp.]|uniref:Uncharacterized protein n=1 Tax=Candidatus Accumulibacter proximus TaxID=2954385 RepID=A0A935Q4I1_9PROT|nr:hypothetical protein [Candidatus Accumulibacter proximus]
MSFAYSYGGRPTRDTGDDRGRKARPSGKRRLRYKISAQPKWLKSLAIQQRRKMRYKMLGDINRLF